MIRTLNVQVYGKRERFSEGAFSSENELFFEMGKIVNYFKSMERVDGLSRPTRREFTSKLEAWERLWPRMLGMYSHIVRNRYAGECVWVKETTVTLGSEYALKWEEFRKMEKFVIDDEIVRVEDCFWDLDNEQVILHTDMEVPWGDEPLSSLIPEEYKKFEDKWRGLKILLDVYRKMLENGELAFREGEEDAERGPVQGYTKDIEDEKKKSVWKRIFG